MNSYGTSEHYLGEKGRDYFRWQNQHAETGARLNARKYAPYIKAGDCVLDFGCGGGWLLHEITCRAKIGVELNREAHATCQANGVTVYESVASVRESPIDVCITNHCLEHVPYPIDALKSLRKLLKADGLLVLTVPIDDWRGQRNYDVVDINHHLHTWTPLLMANTLTEAGFQVKDVKVVTYAWFPGWHRWYGRIPRPLFDAGCILWSMLRRRRQLFAVAVPVGPPNAG